MTYDLGAAVRLTTSVVDLTGAAANVGTMTLTITLPDGTTSVVSPVTASATTGSYSYDYATVSAGRHTVRWVGTGTVLWADTGMFDVRDPADVPVVSLADAKAHLNITTTSYDAELPRYLDAATDLCENYVGRPLRRRSFTEAYDGGAQSVLLRNSPVITVSGVTVSGTAYTGYTLDAGNGILWYDATAAGSWPTGRQAVSVVYTAGYASPPADVVQAVLEATRHLWTTQRGAMSARNPLGGDEYAAASGWSLPRRVMELLEPYRVMGIA